MIVKDSMGSLWVPNIIATKPYDNVTALRCSKVDKVMCLPMSRTLYRAKTLTLRTNNKHVKGNLNEANVLGLTNKG